MVSNVFSSIIILAVLQLMAGMLLFFILAGCATKPSEMMIPRDEKDDLWCVGPPSGMWYGDCEDYAFTKKREIGGEVWHVVLPDWRHHAVLLKDAMVYDTLNDVPVPHASYKALWLFTMSPDPVRICQPAWSLLRSVHDDCR